MAAGRISCDGGGISSDATAKVSRTLSRIFFSEEVADRNHCCTREVESGCRTLSTACV